MKTVVIFAALLSAFPMSARAQSIRQTFQDFGLIGVWAQSCGEPASLERRNFHAIYARAPEDGVMLTYDNGPH